MKRFIALGLLLAASPLLGMEKVGKKNENELSVRLLPAPVADQRGFLTPLASSIGKSINTLDFPEAISVVSQKSGVNQDRRVYRSFDGTVRRGDVVTKNDEAIPVVHTSSVDKHWMSSMALSPDEERIAVAADSMIKIFNVSKQECEATLTGHEGFVYAIDWSPDGKWLASAAADETVRIWNVATKECKTILKEHECCATAVKWSLDGRWIASGSWDKKVRIWNARTFVCVEVLTGHEYGVNSVVWSDENWLISRSNFEIKFWRPSCSVRERQRDVSDGHCCIIF